MVGRFTFTKAPAPELPSKIRAQQAANRVDIDIVLTGTDALAAGIDQKIWVELLPTHAAALPKLEEVLLPGALKMQGLALNQGVIISFSPGGPILEYMPDAVKQPPTSAEELLAYTKQNPNRFMYARPANSGPGRAFLMGLPYLLGDSDPKDPVKGWDKTWAYLQGARQAASSTTRPERPGRRMKELGRRHARYHRDHDRVGRQSTVSRHRARRSTKVGTHKGLPLGVGRCQLRVRSPKGSDAGEDGGVAGA